ncbi:MAG: O-antigen ligase family protein [Pseudomonadota bacterium]
MKYFFIGINFLSFVIFNLYFDFGRFGVSSFLLPSIEAIFFLVIMLKIYRDDPEMDPIYLMGAYTAILPTLFYNICNTAYSVGIYPDSAWIFWIFHLVFLAVIAIFFVKKMISESMIIGILYNASILYNPVYVKFSALSFLIFCAFTIAGFIVLFERYKLEIKLSVIHYAVIAFLFFTFISTIFSDFLWVSTVAFFKVSAFCTLFFVVSFYKDKKKLFKVFLVAFLMTSLAMFFETISVYFERILILGFIDGINRRLFIFQTHPIHIAQFLALVLPFIIIFPVIYKKKINLIFAGLLFLLSLLTLLLTYSRSALAGLFLGFFALFLILTGDLFFRKSFQIRKFHVAIVFFILISVSGSVFLGFKASDAFAQRFDSIFDIKSLKLNNRISDWMLTLRFIKEKPLTGHGLATRKYSFSKYLKDPSLKHLRDYHTIISHNVFLGIGSEIGVFGMLAFIFIYFFSIIKVFAKYYKSNSTDRYYYLILLLSFICIFPSMLVGVFIDTTSVLLWPLFGFASFSSGNRVSSRFQIKFLYLSFILILMLVFLLSALRYVSRYYYDYGTYLVAAKKNNQAEVALLKAYSLIPFNYYYPLELAHLYAEENRWDKAREYYELTLKENPYDLIINIEYSDVLKYSGQAEQSNKVLDYVASFTEQDFSGLLYSRLALTNIEKKDEFIKYFIKILNSDINHFVSFLKQDPKLVEKVLKSVNQIKLNDLSEKALLNYGSFFEKIGLIKMTVYLNDKAADLFHSDLALIKNIQIFRSYRNYEVLLKNLDKLKSGYLYSSIFKSVVYNEIGISEYFMGDLDKALDAFNISQSSWNNLYLDNLIAHVYLEKIYQKQNNLDLVSKEKAKINLIKKDINFWIERCLGNYSGDFQALQIKEFLGR